MEFIKRKIDLSKEIYELLAGISAENGEIQRTVYSLIPNFQIHAKYLPSASKFLRKIFKNNDFLLNDITKTVKFNFDFSDFPDFSDFRKKRENFNILINIIDSSENSDSRAEKVSFSKQDKLTSKPMNLLNFYMNLIWDPNTTIKQEYVKLVRSLCKFQEKGVNINQEMIFKLYNCMVLTKKTNPLTNARV